MDSIMTFSGGQFRLDGHKVAELHGDVLRKLVRGREHLLHKPRRAWAIDAGVLVAAEQRGARVVEVLDTETGTVYRAGIARFHTSGFTIDRGYGEQRALALEHWSTGDTVRPPAAVPVQLGFGFS